MNTQTGSARSGQNSTLGRRIPVRERWAVLRQHGRAAFQQDRALILAARWRTRLDEDQSGHLRVDDSSRRRR